MHDKNETKPKPMYKNMLIGGLSGAVSRTITAPIEMYKIQRQNYFLPNTTLKKTFNVEGITGLWKGNLINCYRIFPTMAINYGTLQFFKQKLDKNPYNNKTTNMIISSTLSGIISVIAMNPLETLRTRFTLQVKKNEYTSIFQGFKKMSLREMYYGTSIALMGYVPFNVISFTVYNKMKHKINVLFPNKQHNKICKILTGGFTGVFAVSFTYPTDLLRRRLHIQGFLSNTKVYTSNMQCVREIYKKEGIRGFYRGLLSAYVKLFPTIAIQFAIIDYFNEV